MRACFQFAIRRPLPQFHAGEASALALAQEMNWWLLINEQRALTFARQHNIKAVTVPEFVVYLYHAHILSYNSASVNWMLLLLIRTLCDARCPTGIAARLKIVTKGKIKMNTILLQNG